MKKPDSRGGSVHDDPMIRGQMVDRGLSYVEVRGPVHAVEDVFTEEVFALTHQRGQYAVVSSDLGH
jgi:hypothetical protein